MEMDERGAVHVLPGEGKKLWVAEELMTFVISGEDTGGGYALTDSTVPPGGEAPPHIHHREDEAFWVLAGELEVVVGKETFGASAGSSVHLPRGVIHTYKNTGATPARFLTLMVPAGLERLFEEVGKPWWTRLPRRPSGKRTWRGCSRSHRSTAWSYRRPPSRRASSPPQVRRPTFRPGWHGAPSWRLFKRPKERARWSGSRRHLGCRTRRRSRPRATGSRGSRSR